MEIFGFKWMKVFRQEEEEDF